MLYIVCKDKCVDVEVLTQRRNVPQSPLSPHVTASTVRMDPSSPDEPTCTEEPWLSEHFTKCTASTHLVLPLHDAHSSSWHTFTCNSSYRTLTSIGQGQQSANQAITDNDGRMYKTLLQCIFLAWTLLSRMNRATHSADRNVITTRDLQTPALQIVQIITAVQLEHALRGTLHNCVNCIASFEDCVQHFCSTVILFCLRKCCRSIRATTSHQDSVWPNLRAVWHQIDDAQKKIEFFLTLKNFFTMVMSRKTLVQWLCLLVTASESVPTLNLFGEGGNSGGGRTRCRPGYEYVTETSYETSYEQQCSTR